MTDAPSEKTILEDLRPQLEAEGYDLVLHPSAVPEFMGGYRPDAVATAKGKKKRIAIEVMSGPERPKGKLERIAKLFEGRDDWELRIIYRPQSGSPPLQIQSSSEIQKRIAETSRLANENELRAALLMAWATFEASARALVPDEFQRPQTPARLVEVLANRGILEPSEADALRAMADKRNRLIHGELKTSATLGQIRDMIAILAKVSATPAQKNRRRA